MVLMTWHNEGVAHRLYAALEPEHRERLQVFACVGKPRAPLARVPGGGWNKHMGGKKCPGGSNGWEQARWETQCWLESRRRCVGTIDSACLKQSQRGR